MLSLLYLFGYVALAPLPAYHPRLQNHCSPVHVYRQDACFCGQLPVQSSYYFLIFPVPFNAWLYITPCSIRNNLMFGPSPFCETSVLYNGSLPTTTMTSADFSFSLDKQRDLPW